MEPTQFDFIFGFYAKLRIKSTQVVFTYVPSFLISGAYFLPEFRNCRGLSKIRTFQIVAQKLK
jgi:hypothetical protein